MARGRATNLKVREIIVRRYSKGESMNQIAKELFMPKSTVGDIIKKYGETGSLEVVGKSPGRPTLVSPRSQRALVDLCKKNRRATIRDITAQWNAAIGLKLSRECCRKWMNRTGLGFYKVRHICNQLHNIHIFFFYAFS